MEKLNGILIATTNLTENLDKAFERRFLYKIRFGKPSLEARCNIWKSMIPSLSDDEALILAESYNLSGGQIENVARKRTIDSIINGKEPSIEDTMAYCNAERIESL
jgi:SpoVK/Ycf46/Vps4 family AAA+-type ATPase